MYRSLYTSSVVVYKLTEVRKFSEPRSPGAQKSENLQATASTIRPAVLILAAHL